MTRYDPQRSYTDCLYREAEYFTFLGVFFTLNVREAPGTDLKLSFILITTVRDAENLYREYKVV